jgi:UDP-N-acetylmuramoyl-L-alanyl-D-glutamate--2,6-diaminopimelate ligase
MGLGIDPQVAAQGIAALDGIPGRMENIAMGQNFTAIVDFAHTPNALKVALEAGRKMTQGRVISIFGSAGLRDKEKRRMMAETSIELADLSILTAEDPRTESLDGILEEMAEGASQRAGSKGRRSGESQIAAKPSSLRCVLPKKATLCFHAARDMNNPCVLEKRNISGMTAMR